MFAIASLWLMLAAANSSAHAQASNPSPADWTQFHRDNMQRWNPYETVLGVGNVSTLALKWKNPISDTNALGLSSSPAVVNGVVYFGSGDDNIYALDASTGAKLWSFATHGSVRSSPALANGVVYFGTFDISSFSGDFYALNANTGAKLWSYNTGYIESSPAVANGVVYIGSDNNNVYALNANTGALLWKYVTGNAVETSPAVANGVVYVASIGVQSIRTERRYRSLTLELCDRKLLLFFTGGGKWGGLCRQQRSQRVCTECQYWRIALEI
jgi:outer membrane protein assembly factor BamB